MDKRPDRPISILMKARHAYLTPGLALTGLALLGIAFAILIMRPSGWLVPAIMASSGLAATAVSLLLMLRRSNGSSTLADSGQKLTRDQFDRVLQSLNEAIFFVGPDGLIKDANSAAGQLLACEPETLIGTDMQSLLSANNRRKSSRQESWRPQEAVFKRSNNEIVSVSYTKSDVLDEAGELLWQVYAVQNVHERKQAENRIRYLARIDALTKMANRMQFQHLLQQAIARARRDGTYLAILYLDVDRFKDINDTFGHSAGDTSLEIFSRRINRVLPEDAVPGRLAGDEFCLILKSTGSIDAVVDEVNRTAETLLESVGEPFRVQDEEIFMSTSIGVAIYPRDGENVVDLLRNADAALYQAKNAGGNCIEFFGEHVASASEERLMLKSKLRRAFEREELRLDYQPKYRLKDGRLAGVEALIRWDLPERGIVLPSDFIPIAEESNLILQLGEWVLNRVCADYREWQRSTPSPCRVSINLSLRQLQQQRFLEGVRRTFQKHGVSPTCFELEITETTLMQDIGRTIKILDSLYGMGLHLAIDDFGTGYSSLSALQQFPISVLKIDQSFVRDLGFDSDNKAICRTIIQMGKSLKLDVVAEGVENEEQLDFLRRNDCDIVQGHLFGDAMSADEFRDLLIADNDGSGRYQALFA